MAKPKHTSSRVKEYFFLSPKGEFTKKNYAVLQYIKIFFSKNGEILLIH